MNAKPSLAPPRFWSSSLTSSPTLLCLLVAVASVVLSCYPVAFFGKSFLSPNNHSGTYLLYGKMPTLAGYSDTTTDDEKGADLGAVMWYSWPASVIESRALLKYHELPLWNRYDSNGIPLLGQGQSMFGDPLHLLVLACGGSSVAWDVKYVLAKVLFSFTIGLCVLHITALPASALIMTASAPFIGFFSYRYAHPAFFSLCYAPLILLCWLKLINSQRAKITAVWLGILVLANWMLLNSGTVKEAYILLLAMNFSGVLAVLFARHVPSGKSLRMRQALFALLLFAAISTPIWFTFLHTLGISGNAYETKTAYQLQPSLFIGLFDDIFYRQFNANENHLDPSTNFLVLAAVLWLLATGRSALDPNRVIPAIALTSVAALTVAFGVVPPAIIVKVPFLGNIQHIDNTFSCIAIVCLMLLAGLGLSAYSRDCASPEFRTIYFRQMIYLLLLLALYFGTTQAGQRSTITLLHAGEHISKSRFFRTYVLLLVSTLIVAPWLGRIAVRNKRSRVWTVPSLLLCFVLIHWRSGMHLKTPFDPYVMNPHGRVQLGTASPVLHAIKTRMQEPVRAAGFDSNFFPGYGGAVGIEQIDGADPLISKDYRSLMRSAGVELVYGAWRYRVSDDRINDELPLFDMLNVGYYLSSPGARIQSSSNLERVASVDLDLYRSKRVWPRAFFTNRIVPYRDDSELIRLLHSNNDLPFAAILPEDLGDRPALRDLAGSASGSLSQMIPATDYSLTANSTSFKIDAPGPGVVVISETYLPEDFVVRLSNVVVPYFRVNSVLKGVFVDHAGSYCVSFVYWPRFFTLTLWLSGGAACVLLVWLIRMARLPAVSRL